MAKKFSRGDTVVLKSGGPLMTVNEYKKIMNPDSGKWEESEEVKCYWFEENEKKFDSFHQDTLVKENIEGY